LKVDIHLESNNVLSKLIGDTLKDLPREIRQCLEENDQKWLDERMTVGQFDKKDPLWQKLEAVQNNRVFTVDFNYWSFGNVLAANAILDDLFKYLVEEWESP